jgi:hypothetical protein
MSMSNLLQQAILAIKAGDRAKGKQLLTAVLQAEPDNELALLWMSTLMSTTEEQVEYLEQVLMVDPDGQPAHQDLVAPHREQSETVVTPPASQSMPPSLSSKSVQISRPEQSLQAQPAKTPSVEITAPLEDEAGLSAPPAPPKTGMTDVFISYSRKDKPFVQKLYETLRAGGREVWIDWGSIPLTSNWRQEIREGIERAGSVIFVMSPDFLASKECRVELDCAVEINKRLVPLV